MNYCRKLVKVKGEIKVVKPKGELLNKLLDIYTLEDQINCNLRIYDPAAEYRQPLNGNPGNEKGVKIGQYYSTRISDITKESPF